MCDTFECLNDFEDDRDEEFSIVELEAQAGQ